MWYLENTTCSHKIWLLMCYMTFILVSLKKNILKTQICARLTDQVVKSSCQVTDPSNQQYHSVLHPMVQHPLLVLSPVVQPMLLTRTSMMTTGNLLTLNGVALAIAGANPTARNDYLLEVNFTSIYIYIYINVIHIYYIIVYHIYNAKPQFESPHCHS